MAAPATPLNLAAQQGNSQVVLTWDLSAGATSYPVYRSTDNVTFALLATATTNEYVDTSATLNTQYYYEITASNGTESSLTESVWAIPTVAGALSLKELRLMAQQRADRVGSQFVTTSEWNSYLNQSLTELYDLMETVYEDYFLATAITFVTDGSSEYALPTGTNYSSALPFYKLVGVDLGLSSSNNARVTVNKFDFIDRNKYVYPSITSTYMGVFNMRYRVMGDYLKFIPTPSAGQYVTMWYVPRMTKLLRDTDVSNGVNGWLEFAIIDAAIKALQKEESDVTVLAQQKQAMIDRINTAAMNRDIGQPDTISATRRNGQGWGGDFSGGGSWGGF
jgi:hypothetical protein